MITSTFVLLLVGEVLLVPVVLAVAQPTHASMHAHHSARLRLARLEIAALFMVPLLSG
jgi:hypothetical protein